MVWEGGNPHKKQGKRPLRLLTVLACQKSHGQLSYSEAETDMMECVGAAQALDITAGPVPEPRGRSKRRSSLPRSHMGRSEWLLEETCRKNIRARLSSEIQWYKYVHISKTRGRGGAAEAAAAAAAAAAASASAAAGGA